MLELPLIRERRVLKQEGALPTELLELTFSNGVQRTYRRLLNAGHGSVVIIPMLDANTVLLVREYAAGLNHYELGPPKGRLDAGETAQEGANRELKEEIGRGAHQLIRLGHLSLEPAYMNHVSDIILAYDLYPESLPGDEPEELEVVAWKLSDLDTLLGRPDVTSGRSLAALFMAREYLAGRYQP